MLGDYGLAPKLFHHILRKCTHRTLLCCILGRIFACFSCYALTKRPLIQSLCMRHLLPLCQEVSVDSRVPRQLDPVSFNPNSPREVCRHLMVLGTNLLILCVLTIIVSISSFHAARCFVYVADYGATRDRSILIACFILLILLRCHRLRPLWYRHPDLNFHVLLLLLFLLE